jgi:hypothetical protein
LKLQPTHNYDLIFVISENYKNLRGTGHHTPDGRAVVFGRGLTTYDAVNVGDTLSFRLHSGLSMCQLPVTRRHFWNPRKIALEMQLDSSQSAFSTKTNVELGRVIPQLREAYIWDVKESGDILELVPSSQEVLCLFEDFEATYKRFENA